MTTPGQSRPADRPAIEIRRSAQRRRTVSARREGDRFVVLVPARMSAAQATAYADELVARIESRERRAAPTDDELHERAQVRYVKFDVTNYLADADREIAKVTNINQIVEVSNVFSISKICFKKCFFHLVA